MFFIWSVKVRKFTVFAELWKYKKRKKIIGGVKQTNKTDKQTNLVESGEPRVESQEPRAESQERRVESGEEKAAKAERSRAALAAVRAR